jgi:hypothetical protein
MVKSEGPVVIVGMGVFVREEVKVAVDVGVFVWVVDEVSVKVGVTGRMITVCVGDGMNGGVGERITGSGDGDTTDVIIGRGRSCPLHATNNSTNTAADRRLFMLFLQSY